MITAKHKGDLASVLNAADLCVGSENVIMWSWLQLRFMAVFFPPAQGFQRISYVCGCGDLSYLDVREISENGIENFRRCILNSTAAVRGRAQNFATPSHEPSAPTPAHLGQDTSASARGDQARINSGVQRRPLQAPDHLITSARAGTPSTPQFLLLCINTKNSTTLTQIEVSTFTSDEYLFREIRLAYQKAREEHEWRFCMFFPKWARNGTESLFARLPGLPALPNYINLFSILRHTLGAARLHRVSSADFVRFHLVPVGEDCCPMWFKAREFPPESEVMKRRYIYEAMPVQDVEISTIPLAELLKPAPHFDTFWMTLFPKKLSEELRRPANGGNHVIGWGIHINESMNWPVVLLGLLAMLVTISVSVVIYSVLTADKSSAFRLGAYLTALLTLYFTYQYQAWKEAPP